MRCVSENPLCQSDPPCDPKIATGDILKSLRRMKLITNCLVYDNKGRRKKFLTVLSRLAGKKLSDSMMEYFMAKDRSRGAQFRSMPCTDCMTGR